MSQTSDLHDLILQKLDDQKESIRELRQDVKDLRDDLTELKTNHLAHLSADIMILKTRAKSNETLGIEREKGRWKVTAAFITGLAGIVAAFTAYLLGR